MLFKIQPSKKRPLEYAHLSAGERAGLREHGMKPHQFDRLDARSKEEWKEELKLDAYQVMRKSKLQKRTN